ncbi:hypothetical protein D1007_45454 [Hordeum vulgare]|nr:hypothetical protein D1007_45454 [Hordeum vulgare]
MVRLEEIREPLRDNSAIDEIIPDSVREPIVESAPELWRQDTSTASLDPKNTDKGRAYVHVVSSKDRLSERPKNSTSLVTMKEALEKRDNELTSAWKDVKRKTLAAEAKLKSVGDLEEENRLLKASAEKTTTKLAELKKHYTEWEANLEKATAKKSELEKSIEDFNVELYEKLKAFAANVEEDTARIEKELDPKRGLLKDNDALCLLGLEDRVDFVVACFKVLHSDNGKINQEEVPEDARVKDAEAIVIRVKAE